MRKVIQSLRRDHRYTEQILRVLEQECDVFSRPERPDYELVGEIIDYLKSFLEQYYHPRDDLLFKVARSNAACAGIIADITSERAGAASNLQALGDALREILNEQRVSRQTFENAARGFILHERRQIKLEEQNLFPLAESALVDAEWQRLHASLRDENTSPRTRQIKERLRDKRRWIVREEAADQAARKAAPAAGSR